MPGDASRDLEVLVRVAQAVQVGFRRSSTSPHGADVVAMGADGTPTEEVDRAAEAQVLSALDQEGVDWDVLSEEAGVVRRGGGPLLVVDPIDGSHNALRGLPYATVSLALGRGTLGGIEVGVVRDLYRGTTNWAERGGGAFRDGRRLKTRPWTPRAELVFLNLGRHATPRVVARAASARRVRSLGCASLEMLAVAEGAADAYLFENDAPERNLRVTDIAAAYRILREAGGDGSDLGGTSLEALPLGLERRTSVFAWADPAFARQARAEGGP
ncbi:MAG TPA: inositol monophosphatase family protein [Thermoplasmata archaeon]|nr:inositol monophosphatase family protein [Thermoplasmata archaeon]